MQKVSLFLITRSVLFWCGKVENNEKRTSRMIFIFVCRSTLLQLIFNRLLNDRFYSKCSKQNCMANVTCETWNGSDNECFNSVVVLCEIYFDSGNTEISPDKGLTYDNVSEHLAAVSYNNKNLNLYTLRNNPNVIVAYDRQFIHSPHSSPFISWLLDDFHFF